MLALLNENFRSSRFAALLDRFLRSGVFVALVAVLAAVSNIFGRELLVYYLFLLLTAVVAVFSFDLLPFAPIMLFTYITVSSSQNPAASYGTSIFQQTYFIVHLVIIAVCAVGLITARVAVDIKCRARLEGRFKKLPSVFSGIALLGLSYLLAGMFNDEFAPFYKSALFGAVQFICLAAPLVLFAFTVDWKKADKLYFAKVFTAMGLAVAAEVAGIYSVALGKGGTFNRGMLNTGWGVYNNVGFVLAFCAPCPFLLAIREKRPISRIIEGCVIELALLFTQSRGSILSGSLLFFVSAAVAVLKTDGEKRKRIFLTYGFTVLAILIAALALLPHILKIYDSLIDTGMNDNSRFDIYREGYSQFLNRFLFGNGFYACHNFRYGHLPADAFLPPRYHNTIVQLLATGGVVSFAAYLFHRLQTIRLLLERPSLEKLFILFMTLVLILAGLVDCHFFNMAPSLMYSFALCFACAEDIARDGQQVRDGQQAVSPAKVNTVKNAAF